MARKFYRFTIEGSAANGQTWMTKGNVDGEFHDIFHVVMRASFEQLLKGRAVYGMPGVGCSGPYDIDRVLIEQVKH